ncbi:MAG: endo-1,4-beta-xylanase [Lachnospiraceae bacterium]|nr:endo-1,4-beta-xylanase [Lachnospiraceae bacterium]
MAEKYILKDVYKDIFKVGVACERITEKFTCHEIGNPDKESLMARQFSSMTFANELKPMYNMGFKSPEATEENLPFVINENALKMLNWARDNKMPVRGHVLLWHSQCPKEIFCKNYEAVTFPTDPKELEEKPFLKYFEKLNPVCYVDRDTLLKRLRSYIFSLMEFMYKEGFANTIYAWDVVNEAIELDDRTETGLRNTYWYQIIGDDLIYWAFRYAYDAVNEMSAKYSLPRPLLFYNDYNEFQPKKQAAIIAALEREGHGHGSVISEGLIDGIGLQGHLSDNNDIEEYKTAVLKYGKLVKELHVTELDVKCTCSNANAFYYQAVFYKKFFEMLLECKKEGANITSVTFWGLTDDNSWIQGANPLLFDKDLMPKPSFDAVVFAAVGGDLGEPLTITYDLSDRYVSFEPLSDGSAPSLDALSLKFKVDHGAEITDKKVHSGKYALSSGMRFGAWTGVRVDVSDFLGQSIRFKAFVSSPADAVNLRFNSEFGTVVASTKTGSDDWALLEGCFKIPGNEHSMYLFFSTDEPVANKFSPVYIDDISIELVGLEEGFEEENYIFAIRGMGHLPFISVTDKEARSVGGHSLHVTRHEKDATVKFNVSSYIGHSIKAKAYVKTTDSLIRIGLDGTEPLKLNEVKSTGDWTEITAEVSLSSDLKSAELYIETDGASDFFVDDVFVTLA